MCTATTPLHCETAARMSLRNASYKSAASVGIAFMLCVKTSMAVFLKASFSLQGGKLSVLTAAVDSRVAALCLLDPVDNTIWAPLGPGYPSGVEALKTLGRKQVISETQHRLPSIFMNMSMATKGFWGH